MLARYAPALLIVSVVLACKARRADEAEVKNFYENARRRTATALEAEPILRLNGCTGFFVQNQQSKALAISATHCVKGDFQTWCTNGGSVTDARGTTRKCTKVHLSGPRHDIALLEFEATNYRPAGFRLGTFQVPKLLTLKALGYPADQFATGGLMVTENCWVTAESATDNRQRYGQDESAEHNCSIYGGNSGGPMIAEGADVVIGLPNTYTPNDFDNKPFDQTATTFLAKMSDFTTVHKQALEGLGVALVETTIKSNRDQLDYTPAATYTSATYPGCRFVVLPKYFTGRFARSVRVIYQGDQGSGCGGNTDNFTCTEVENNVCTSGQARLTDFTPNGFKYHSPNGGSADFRR